MISILIAIALIIAGLMMYDVEWGIKAIVFFILSWVPSVILFMGWVMLGMYFSLEEALGTNVFQYIQVLWLMLIFHLILKYKIDVDTIQEG